MGEGSGYKDGLYIVTGKNKSCRHTYNMRATDRFIVPKMNTSFGDATL